VSESAKKKIGQLPVLKLADLLHLSWTADRQRQGWKYGPVLDPKSKTHPLLLPFEKLKETDKQFGIAIVTLSISSILELGYSIEKESEAATKQSIEQIYSTFSSSSSIYSWPFVIRDQRVWAAFSKNHASNATSSSTTVASLASIASIAGASSLMNNNNNTGTGGVSTRLDELEYVNRLSLERLVDLVAENAHESWAEKRTAEGWKYGRRFNEAQRTHPSLRPFVDLPEQEREKEKALASAIVRALLFWGHCIIKFQDHLGDDL